MYPKNHIIINFLISLLLFFILPYAYVLIFFLSSILIDMDHYLYYIIKEKNLSLKKAYNWFKIRELKWRALSAKERKNHSLAVIIFHGIEPITILFIFSFIYAPIFYIALGFLVHLIEDLIEEIPLEVTKRKVFLSYSIYIYLTKTKFYEK